MTKATATIFITHHHTPPADKRTDVWAFGCVLYELLTGRQPFTGATVPDVVASVLESESDLHTLPDDVPAAVRRLIQRCLQKDSRDRLRDIGDAGLEIKDALAGTFDGAPTAPRRAATFRISILPWTVAALAIGLSALGLIHRPDAVAPGIVGGVAVPRAGPPPSRIDCAATGVNAQSKTHVGLLGRTRSLLNATGAGAAVRKPVNLIGCKCIHAPRVAIAAGIRVA
jgi:protein tyrosine kinase